MASNVKLGVDLADFKSGIREGQNILKGLNAEMKNTEAEFKATGDAEAQLTQKTKTLNSQIQVQKGIADQARQALEAMEKAGIKPTDAAYQQMYATMMRANAGMNEAQAALNALGTEAGTAAKNAGDLNENVKSLGKKISLDQVITGVEKITNGLEKAAKAAIKVGKALMTETLGAANWADELATTAKAYGISTDELQRMEKTAQIIDTSVEDILQARQRLGKNKSTVTELFGIETEGRSIEDVFWETGEAIMAMGDAFEQEEAAQKIFGKGWRDLVPLFDAGREEYERINGTWKTVSDEQMTALQNLDDQYQTLKNDLETLKMETLSQLAEPLAGVMEKFNEFLNSDQGQKIIGDVMGAIKDALEWITGHSGEAVAAITAIAGAFGLLKATEGVLSIIKLIDGIKTITGKGTAAGAGTAAATGSGLTTALTTGIGGLLPNILSWVSTNGVPVMDWLTHESPIASVLNGQESLGDWWNRLTQEQQERTETFADNWNPNSAEANILMQNAKNNIVYWDNIHKQQLAAEEWNFGDMSIDEIMEQINGGKPVEVPAEVDVETTAADIAQEVGPVKVPVQLEVLDWRPSFMRGHANGLPYVPYDGYLAMLHRGERVLTASANRNYTYNSNNYFGNVNLNNGQDIDALCTSIDRHNRQMQSGFGA